MKTDRLLKVMLLVMMVTIVSPAFSVATTINSKPASETPEQKLERLTKRIEEIKAMDKRSLTKAERKALKKEVRDIRDEAKALSGGVYISIGALLVIILLLILLL